MFFSLCPVGEIKLIDWLTVHGTVLKESDDLVISGVTFDSKMNFEKHLRSVSRAASQRLGISRKSCRVFHDRALLGRCFRCLVLPVLEYPSAVWCSAADTHLKLLYREISGTRFLTAGVFECDIAHRRSVAVLLCCIRSGVTRCTLLIVLYLDRICQCRLHAVLWLHIGILMMRRLAAEPCSTAGLLLPSHIPLERPCCPRIRWYGLAGFKSRANDFLLA